MRNLVAIEEELVAGFAQTESNPWKMLRNGVDRNEAQVKKEKGDLDLNEAQWKENCWEAKNKRRRRNV